jgi:hypothetical protein
MSSHVSERMSAAEEPTLTAADTQKLSDLYREQSDPATPEWCDLTPQLESTRQGDDILGGVRL